MPVPFPRTSRALEGDSLRRAVVGLVPVLVFLAAWTIWFVWGRVTLYGVSERAWLSVDRETYPVAAAVPGRVARLHIALGRRVQRGEILAELDADEQRALLAEQQARAASLTDEVALLGVQIAAARDALAGRGRAMTGSVGEARAKLAEAEAAAALASQDADRLARLEGSGLVAAADVARARSLAGQRRAAFESARRALERVTWEERTAQGDRRADIAELERERTALAGESARIAAVIQSVAHAVELRMIRAPIPGRLGQIVPLQVGSFLAAGAPLGVVVPDGPLKIIAEFSPADAAGRIRPHQGAHFHLAGFPSTQFGAVPASVLSVADEPRDGRIRVELVAHPRRQARPPLQHGLPGTVEIEVEHVSPVELVLRTLGRILDRTVGSTAPSS